MLLVDQIAATIRYADGNNRAKPEALAMAIEDGLQDLDIYAVQWKPLAEFLQCTNPDKRINAGRLAELIVAEFNLSQEG